MRNTLAIKTLLVVAASALLAHTAAALTTVRYNVSASFTNTGVDTNAAGHVRAVLRQNGNSDQRRLQINVRGLDPQTIYTVLAQGEDTNTVLTVTTFKTARTGRGTVHYFQNTALRTNGHNGHGAGVNSHALPASISDLTQVRTLSIADSNGTVVLSVNMQDPSVLKYEVTSTFENTGTDPQAIGVLAMAIQPGDSTTDAYYQFRLFAVGQSSEYTLFVNGENETDKVAHYQADYSGRIAAGMFPSSAPSPLNIRSLAIKNAANQVVLETTLR